MRAFADPLSFTRQDRIVDGELRWQTLGRVGDQCLLVVAHTVQEVDEDDPVVEVIRIMPARRADKKERKRNENEPR